MNTITRPSRESPASRRVEVTPSGKPRLLQMDGRSVNRRQQRQ